MDIKKSNSKIIFCLVIFAIISIITINSTSINKSFVTKQFAWYLIGFTTIFLLRKSSIKNLIKHAWFLYILTNIILVLLLFIGREINGSKSWFIIPGIGSIQPSEFAKIALIIINTKILKSRNGKTFGDDLKLFCIIMLLTLVPSILTFLQPDTGMVIIYFLISITMLFIYGIRKSIFIIFISILIIIFSCFIFFYFYYQDVFINIFGTSFFYRIDRLLDWTNNSGMQLINAMSIIKAAGLLGFGIGNTPLYIPEAHTDFIFSIYANNFGLIGVIFLISILLVFDYNLFTIMRDSKKRIYKYMIIGFLSIIIYQQIQNIGMNVGLLPITGITLPFISYGGSSLLSYMIIIGLIISQKNISYD